MSLNLRFTVLYIYFESQIFSYTDDIIEDINLLDPDINILHKHSAMFYWSP